ncbi:MAG: hypothetical protein B7X07_03725 [Actinobacteria bacterium 21-64-8]|nr:MAG: hypothetical protein B7X07_03725 [Actinobacteria bacterium 21-64-8]
MTRQRVLVVGDVMLDVVVRPRGALEPTSDTASEVRVSRVVGACGDDDAAGLVELALTRGGVRPLLQRTVASTGVVVALVSDDGQRAMMTDRGANQLLDTDFVLAALGDVTHVHVSGYLLLDVATRDLARAALREARARRISTSLDVCSVAPLRAMTPARFFDASVDVQTLFANEEEALTLAGVDVLDDALNTLSSRFDEVLVTRGERGAWLEVAGTRHSVDARHVVVCDTTGAGDAATGAYLAARLSGASVVVAMRAAMDAGAAAVGQLGAPS